MLPLPFSSPHSKTSDFTQTGEGSRLRTRRAAGLLAGWPLSLLSVLLLLGATTLGRAFNLTPISATFEPKGRGTVQTFRVSNESSNRIAFQISILSREPDESGKETNDPITNLFTVFPPQGAVEPQKSQTVRVVWKGPANPTNELCYRILAEELPVNFDPKEKGVHIRMLVRYLGTIYVKPRNATAKLQVLDCALQQGEGKDGLELVVTNRGSAHQVLYGSQLTLRPAQGSPVILEGDQLKGLEGENVLPCRARRFRLNCPPNLTKGPVSAELKTHD